MMHAPTLHLGHLHLSVGSLLLALALILALLLTQRTAPDAGIGKEAMWDASLFAAIAALVISRILLILTNLKSFIAYPFLVLTLPSVTFSGLFLTALALLFYLHQRHLPFANFLDAAAPPLALLWGILSIGSLFSGRMGAPTHIPWAIHDPMLGPVHPVEIYTASAAFTLTILLLRVLSHRPPGGVTAATGLFFAGAIAFFLDYLAQPAATTRIILLDPVQWLALAMLLAGALTLLPKLQSREHAQ